MLSLIFRHVGVNSQQLPQSLLPLCPFRAVLFSYFLHDSLRCFCFPKRSTTPPFFLFPYNRSSPPPPSPSADCCFFTCTIFFFISIRNCPFSPGKNSFLVNEAILFPFPPFCFYVPIKPPFFLPFWTRSVSILFGARRRSFFPLFKRTHFSFP